MATSPFTILTVDGDYEFDTRTGHEHLLTLKGTFDGATVTLTAFNNATNAYTSVDGGSWTAESETRFIAPSGSIKLTVTHDGASTSIAVNLLPIIRAL